MERRPVAAWLWLARAFHLMTQRLEEQSRGDGLSMAQFDVLSHVGSCEGLTQQELADALLVTKGNVCQILDRMERAGLLARCQQGRANRLFLSEQGRELYERVVPRQRHEIGRLFAGLSVEEQDQLVYLLRKLERSLESCNTDVTPVR